MCGEKGVKGVIMISAGFREVGPAGIEREQQIKDICTEYGISLIGIIGFLAAAVMGIWLLIAILKQGRL